MSKPIHILSAGACESHVPVVNSEPALIQSPNGIEDTIKQFE
jgi:hypothetical protein